LLFNPLNAKLNPICHLLALLGAHPILHVSRIRVNKHIHRSVLIVTGYFEIFIKKGVDYSGVKIFNNLQSDIIHTSGNLKKLKKNCKTFFDCTLYAHGGIFQMVH
jgi:hypothetical protein